MSVSLDAAGNTRVVSKKALALCLTSTYQAVGRSEGKLLSDVADSSVTSQTRTKDKTVARRKSDVLVK